MWATGSLQREEESTWGQTHSTSWGPQTQTWLSLHFRKGERETELQFIADARLSYMFQEEHIFDIHNTIKKTGSFQETENYRSKI